MGAKNREVGKMSTDREKHRGSIRLQSYDYAQVGAYFITICSHRRQCLFGEIHDGQMRVNPAGTMVQQNWEALSERFPFIVTDSFVIMPNHLHGVVCLTEQDVATSGPISTSGPNEDEQIRGGRTQGSPLQASAEEYRHPQGTQNGTVGRVMQAFKSITTYQYTQGVKQSGWRPFEVRVWQRNYYEHIIRHEEALSGIREYIAANPANWAEDMDNPDNPSGPS